MRLSGRLFGLACMVLTLSLLAGCEPSPVKVTGTVLRGGKPLPVSATGIVQVKLIPDVAPGTAYTPYLARCDAEGKFEIVNVKPGKYKVAVEHLDPTPQTDKLEGAFAEGKTSIIRDVDGKKPMEIDLAHP